MFTDAAVPLIDALSSLRPGTPRSDLRRLLDGGRVTVNGIVVKVARTPVAAGDAVRVTDAARAAAPRLPFAVVHADDDLLVIDKPPGLLTSTGPREKRPTALAIVRAWAAVERPRAKVGLVHRLDADASGLLVFSLNGAAFASLKQQFFDHTAGRTYAAVVDVRVTPPAGTIKSLLVEHVDGTVHATRAAGHGRPAVTHYATDRTAGPYTLLRVTLETGRKHQIRAHLSGRGWPIVGDRLYDGSTAERLMLAAVKLELTHPGSGERVTFEVDVPKSISDLLA